MERELGHGAVHTSLDLIRKLETEPYLIGDPDLLGLAAEALIRRGTSRWSWGSPCSPPRSPWRLLLPSRRRCGGTHHGPLRLRLGLGISAGAQSFHPLPEPHQRARARGFSRGVDPEGAVQESRRVARGLEVRAAAGLLSLLPPTDLM
jgi:hypothetical protein